MDYVAPFAVFLFFFAVLVLQAGRGGEGLGARLAACRAARREPLVLPARGKGVERFVTYGGYAAWSIGLAGLIGAIFDDRLLGLLAPSGLLLAAIGVTIATDRGGVRSRLQARHERSLTYALTRRGEPTDLTGPGLVAVGVIWFGLGVAALAGAFS